LEKLLWRRFLDDLQDLVDQIRIQRRRRFIE
jgi:hypothetical protein